MSIWKDDSGRSHVGVMVGRKRLHRLVPKGASASDAKQLEADLRGSLVKRAPAIPGDMPMTDVLGLFVQYAEARLRSPHTAIGHAHRIGAWAVKYRASQARECAAHIIADMIPHYAPGTINRSLGTLKRGLRVAWESGATQVNYGDHIALLPEHNQRETTLELDQVALLADACNAPTRAAVWIATYTGMRRGEILKLRPADIGAHSLTVQAGNTKTERVRVVPIIAPLRPWLESVPIGTNFEGLKTSFRRARDRVGLPHVTFHDLRRTCATLMIRSGVDLYVVSKLLGHSSVAVTQQRYGHLQIEQITQGLERTFGK